MSNERFLRIATLCATGIATPFLIATTILSLESCGWYYSRDVTAFCFGYIPLAATIFLSAASLRNHHKQTKAPSRLFNLLDLSAAVSYISILLPIWIVEVGANGSAMGLLTGYLTSMMLFNMFVHLYLSIRTIGSMIFLAFRRHPVECPNCHTNLAWPTKVAQTSQNSNTYTWLRGEDYLDEEASPIMSIRASEDTVQSDDETVRGGNKGKAAIEI